MPSGHGDLFESNAFAAALGCSRLYCFVCSRTRTADDLLAYFVAAIRSLGGVPEE